MTEADVFSHLLSLLEKYRTDQKKGAVLEYYSPADLREKLDLQDSSRLQSYDEIFVWVEKYLKYSVKTGHPQFWNRMWADANLPAIIGEFVSTIAHTSACTFESAPVSTEMEKYLIDEFLMLANFKHGEGQMTTGSSNSNMIAMMAARNLAISDAKTSGLSSAPKLVAFVNAEAHYSMDKAANVLGIGTDNVIKIPVDDHGKMRIDVLAKEIKAAKKAGKVPFFVGATAATTVRGAYDPVDEICQLRDTCETDFWVHVDGAWGGSVFLSPQRCHEFLPGLERADSFTFDFHKMHGIPMVCNFLLINGRRGKGVEVFQSTIASGNDDYIFRGTDQERPADLGALSLQCGRHVDVLKIFLAWKYYGRDGFVERIERFLQKAEFAENLVRKTPELELIVPRESFNINFRMRSPKGICPDMLNQQIRQTLYEDGTAIVGLGRLNDQTSIRLLIANDMASKTDIEQFFDAVLATGKTLIAAHQG